MGNTLENCQSDRAVNVIEPSTPDAAGVNNSLFPLALLMTGSSSCRNLKANARDVLGLASEWPRQDYRANSTIRCSSLGSRTILSKASKSKASK